MGYKIRALKEGVGQGVDFARGSIYHREGLYPTELCRLVALSPLFLLVLF